MSHTVAVGEFEGPLGVLLDLVERNQLEVSRISVGRITTNYLEHVHQLANVGPEELSEFLQLGARLLYIKSLALLPQTDSDEQTRELQQLSLELDEYRRFQAAAKLLASRGSQRTWQRPASPRRSGADQPLPALSLDQLAEAFSRALKFAPAVPRHTALQPHLSLETVTAKLHRKLPAGFDLHTIIEGCRDRLEVVVTFLALLELIRNGAAYVIQAGQFDPIRVEAASAKVAHE
ncbi:MAG TPA: segregation/condensation protein A [Candidatus Saccharimonadia bacterium]|nr:segregation/condensation protein A [Candidatus Saccharimonadia bacterium]